MFKAASIARISRLLSRQVSSTFSITEAPKLESSRYGRQPIEAVVGDDIGWSQLSIGWSGLSGSCAVLGSASGIQRKFKNTYSDDELSQHQGSLGSLMAKFLRFSCQIPLTACFVRCFDMF